MSDNKTKYYETVAFLALSQIKGVGFTTIKKIAKENLSFYEFLKSFSFAEFNGKLKTFASKSIHTEGLPEWELYRDNIWNAGLALLKRLYEIKVKVLFKYDDGFPENLKNIIDPPQWLFVQGSVSTLNKPSMAIIGTRAPSDDGLFLAKYIGLLLNEFKYITVSGLAQGIDQIIHHYSIEMNVPTIAILGTGFFVNYPANTDGLRMAITHNGGAIITEYLPNQSYSAANFVNRNRLQAGLADIVIPVEWKYKSGTAHTVNYAKKFLKDIICLRLTNWNVNRDELEYAKNIGGSIFTVPGSGRDLINKINDVYSKKTIHKKFEAKQLTLFGEDFA